MEFDWVLTLAPNTEHIVMDDRLLSREDVIFRLESEGTGTALEETLLAEEQEQTTVLEQATWPEGCVARGCPGAIVRGSVQGWAWGAAWRGRGIGAREAAW